MVNRWTMLAALMLVWVRISNGTRSGLRRGGLLLQRPWRWYLSNIHNPNNPVDRSIRWFAEKVLAGIQKTVRGSVIVIRTVLALILGSIAAIGDTFLAGLVGLAFIDSEPWRLLLLVLVAIISAATTIPWFVSASSVSAVIVRFRETIQLQILALVIIIVIYVGLWVFD